MSKPGKFLITTPIYYPNSKPHLGTLYSTLLADILARWNRLLGKDVMFLTGLDEHGQKIADAAHSKNLSPQDFVDQMKQPFIDCWKGYDINYDKFVRTSSEEHVSAVQKLFKILIQKDYIYKSNYVGFYCTPCESFVTLQTTDDPSICPSCTRKTSEVEEENYFFRLSLFQEKLLDFYAKNPNFVVPNNRLNEVISFVKSGLKDLSITRKNVNWGIKFPGDESHTIYVWGDALTNYISGIGFGSDNASMQSCFTKFWPADMHVIGKDIIRFHAVYWPAFLMAADLLLPERLLVHGYILVDNQKMSKSLGNSVDPMELAKTIGTEKVRYYLAKNMAITQDGSFDLNELKNVYNADLANNLGNLVSRLFMLANKNDITTIKPVDPVDVECRELLQNCESAWKDFANFMSAGLIHQAIYVATDLCSAINSLLHHKEPWRIGKDRKDVVQEVIATSFQALFQVATFLYPVIPTKISELFLLINISPNKITHLFKDLSDWQQTLTLTKEKLQPLFPRMEDVAFANAEKKTGNNQAAVNQVNNDKNTSEISEIDFETFCKIKLAIGKIISAESVTGSDKLLKLQVNFGNLGIKQVVSGIAKHFNCNEITGQKATFVINLEKRKIFGLISEAMLLIAKDKTCFSIITPFDGKVEEGTILS